jgi:hypothetical protein
VATVAVVQGSLMSLGALEAVAFGSVTVAAQVGPAEDEIVIDVTRPPTSGTGFRLLGGDSISQTVADLWIYGDYAYSGTRPRSCGGSGPSCESLPGWLMVWRLQADGTPVAVDSVRMPAVMVNDVKVAASGEFAVASLERGGPDNGFVVLDLADPSAPVIVSQYTRDLEGGVHNVWIERIDGTDYAFVVENGPGDTEGLHVFDLTDRSLPRLVGRYLGGSSIVHDVFVRDGLAFVSHWDDGLVILDVGNGVVGGSPSDPIEVGRVQTEGGHTHNAWYWPGREVVFVGEERFPPPGDSLDVGRLHVVDVSDLTAPVEIGSFGLPGTTPHNFWLDENAAVLYAGWYRRGVRAIDVSGSLSGDLSSREIGWIIPSGSRGAANVWAAQLHRGIVYLSDMGHGLWAVRLEP